MNKVLLLICAALVVLSSASADAQLKDGFGIGVMVGEPTGISIKKKTSENAAVAAGLAWSFSENASFQLNLDYLWHNFELFGSPGVGDRLPLYFGLGARVKLKDSGGSGGNKDDALVGARVPVGISYIFADAPVDVFIEVVPILDLVPETEFRWGSALGVHFYF